jgi:hypothetical protein
VSDPLDWLAPTVAAWKAGPRDYVEACPLPPATTDEEMAALIVMTLRQFDGELCGSDYRSQEQFRTRVAATVYALLVPYVGRLGIPNAFTVDVRINESYTIDVFVVDLEEKARVEARAEMRAETRLHERARANYDTWLRWFTERYGDRIGTWLAKRAAKLVRGKEHVSNHRVCEIGDRFQEAEYASERGRGCCGQVDAVLTHWPTGRKFRLGFNHGH